MRTRRPRSTRTCRRGRRPPSGRGRSGRSRPARRRRPRCGRFRRRKRDVEGVVAEVAAVASAHGGCRWRAIRPPRHRTSWCRSPAAGTVRSRPARQQVRRRRACSRFVKNATRRAPCCHLVREVPEPRPVLDVEGADAGVDDAFGARHAAVEDQRAARSRTSSRHAHRTSAATCRCSCRPDTAVRAALLIVADGTRQRILREVAGRHLEGHAVVHGLGRASRSRRRDDPASRVTPWALRWKAPDADRQRRWPLRRQLARRLGDDVHHAAHRIGAPDGRGRPADHLDLLDLVRVGRARSPTSPCRRSRGRCDRPSTSASCDVASVDVAPAAGHVDVARRHLRDVHAGHRPQQVADVGGRGVLDRLRGDDADGGGRVDELLLRRGRRTTTTCSSNAGGGPLGGRRAVQAPAGRCACADAASSADARARHTHAR